MASLGEQLCTAYKFGLHEKAETLLRDHPDLDVNWKDETGWTALHYTCDSGHAEVVKLLLAHPSIDVNAQTVAGSTPFLLSCSNSQESVMKLLLNDFRVDIILPDNNKRCTSLWLATCWGHLKVIELLIASGRDLGDLNQKEEWVDAFAALEYSRRDDNAEVVSLLETFIANPQLVRYQVREKLGMLDEMAAEIFALVIFACDGLLRLKSTSVAPTTFLPASRFFAMAARLPMELQMILCCHVVGSMKQNILRKDSEPAFKSLARTLLFPKYQ
jgi:hypothetical protein